MLAAIGWLKLSTWHFRHLPINKYNQTPQPQNIAFFAFILEGQRIDTFDEKLQKMIIRQFNSTKKPNMVGNRCQLSENNGTHAIPISNYRPPSTQRRGTLSKSNEKIGGD